MKQAVCVIILNNDNQVLGVSRKDNHLLIDFPGGKVEPYDLSLREAIKRETLEETGLTLINLKLVFGEEYGGFEQFVYTADYVGEINFNSAVETHLVKWVEPEVVMEGAFGDFNEKVLKKIGITRKVKLSQIEKINKFFDSEEGKKKAQEFRDELVAKEQNLLTKKSEYDLMSDEDFKNLIISEEKVQDNNYGAKDSDTMSNILSVMVEYGKEFMPRKWDNFAAKYTRYKGLTAILFVGQGSFIRIKSAKKVLYQQN